MKFLTISFILLLLTFSELDGVREQFQTAQNNKEQALSFYQSTNKLVTKDATLLGYKAAGKMLQSKYEKGKQQKKDLFKEGATNLNELIVANPNNIEIRFIRLTIQQNTPALLKYNTNIDEDKALVFSQYKNADTKLQIFIKQYVTESNKFNLTEIKKLN